MSPERLGLIGGIAGGVIGVLGGLIGTYVSVRNTDGPRERAFVIGLSAALWAWISLALGTAFALPSAWRFLAILAGQAPLFFLPRLNALQERIRREERAARTGDAESPY